MKSFSAPYVVLKFVVPHILTHAMCATNEHDAIAQARTAAWANPSTLYRAFRVDGNTHTVRAEFVRMGNRVLGGICR